MVAAMVLMPSVKVRRDLAQDRARDHGDGDRLAERSCQPQDGRPDYPGPYPRQAYFPDDLLSCSS